MHRGVLAGGTPLRRCGRVSGGGSVTSGRPALRTHGISQAFLCCRAPGERSEGSEEVMPVEPKIPTRMGDGALVEMTRSEIKADLEEGTKAAAKRAKVPELTQDE